VAKIADPENRRIAFRFAFVAIALGLITCWYSLSYHPRAFRGAGGIRDSGVFSYPRFHVELNQVPLFEDGKHRLAFRGVPSEEMRLQFDVIGKTGQDAKELGSLTTEINVRLSDDQGNVLCTASGTPASRAWILTYSADYASFYNLSCGNLRMNRRRSYALQLEVKGADANTPKIFLRPTLLGGGNELP
jgi:hypothetical protein